MRVESKVRRISASGFRTSWSRPNGLPSFCLVALASIIQPTTKTQAVPSRLRVHFIDGKRTSSVAVQQFYYTKEKHGTTFADTSGVSTSEPSLDAKCWLDSSHCAAMLPPDAKPRPERFGQIMALVYEANLASRPLSSELIVSVAAIDGTQHYSVGGTRYPRQPDSHLLLFRNQGGTVCSLYGELCSIDLSGDVRIRARKVDDKNAWVLGEPDLIPHGSIIALLQPDMERPCEEGDGFFMMLGDQALQKAVFGLGGSLRASWGDCKPSSSAWNGRERDF